MSDTLLKDLNGPIGLVPGAAPVYPAGSEVLTVGVGKEFSTISAAVNASKDGDVILVDAGTYTNDFVDNWTKLTIIGVGGMVNMVATEPPPNEKAIFTQDANLTLENFSFSGAAIPASEGGNAAGIRYEAGTLNLINDSFIGNQNGVLGGTGIDNAPHIINVTNCLFSQNGSGSGNTHNIYIGAIDDLTVKNSIFEQANVGHELKSRANNNDLENNLFYDGPTGTASYDIDLPDGGDDLVKNNVIEKGPDAENDAMVHFGGEGLPYANSALTIQGNTFVNDLGPQAVAVLNQAGIPVTITGNTFDNIAAGQIASGPAVQTGNVTGDGAKLPDSSNTDPVPGDSQIFTDSLPHTVVLTASQTGVRGGGGLLTVTAIAGQIVAEGGSGGMDFSEGPLSGANQITTAAGSTNTLNLTGQDTVLSRGADTITTGSLNVIGEVDGSATVTDGSGYDNWIVTGTAKLIGTGSNPFVTARSGANVSLTGTLASLHFQSTGGTVTVNETQAAPSSLPGEHISFTVTGGSTSGIIYDGVTRLNTASGTSQGATIHLGDGVTQLTSNGPDTIYAGAGADTVIMSGLAVLYAGTGTLDVVGRGIPKGSEAKVYGNGGACTFDGDTGNIFYYGGAKANTVNLNLSNNTLYGGAGRMTINGGLSERIIGGTGGVTYNAQGGSATISTAAKSSNVLNLGTVSSVDSWGNDTINGGSGNDTITVHGNAVLNGGTGNRAITLMGRDTLNGIGNDGITVTAGANVTIIAGNLDNISETAATVAVSLGGAYAANAIVSGGSASITASKSAGLNVVTNAGATTSVALGSGPATVRTLGAATIHGSVGTATVLDAADNTQIWGGAGSIAVIQQSGLATRMSFIAGSGAASVSLSLGGATVEFGAGKTTVQEDAGGNTYDFTAGHGGGTDIISAFRQGSDHLLLQGVTVKSESLANGTASVILSDNTHLQVGNVASLSHLFG